MRRLALVACLCATPLYVGCAKPRPQLELPMPPLAPPPAPPRVVAIYDPEIIEPVPVPEPEPVEFAQPPAPRQPRPRATPESDTTAKAAPSRAEPDRVRAPSPTLTLKPMAGSEAKTEAAIRDMLRSTAGNLARVNVPGLDNDGRTQYDTARGFLQQAEEALTSRNLVFAGKLADKAATLAAVLVR